ncbi:MAG: polyprenyl synthetase family protein [Chloroflexi bacterium]|nr:polyprenyl synthetase family protein [Chloroflexota bacterium]
MSINKLTALMLQAIEAELRMQVARLDEPITRPFHEMLTYHMGWTGEGAGPEAQGKRIRPQLLLLACAACNADWKAALPAAAAVELVHNFSLVHDDIQDNSDKRRGRDTVWVKWGMPQGINAGDALFVLSNQAMLDLAPTHPAETVVKAIKILHDSCLDLTRGQYLDMSYEQRTDLTIEDYWSLITGKTAALLAACCALGSLLSEVDEVTQEAYRDFGHYLGLAFQVQDDLLGIWGDSRLTGKSAESDLVSGKKSLPVLYGLGKNGPFARRWIEGPVRLEEVAGLAEQLAAEGAQLYTQETADQMTDLALQSLRMADPQGEAGEALFELSHKLLNREA